MTLALCLHLYKWKQKALRGLGIEVLTELGQIAVTFADAVDEKHTFKSFGIRAGLATLASEPSEQD